jgi:glutamate/aspartate transport system substrate-binding protein
MKLSSYIVVFFSALLMAGVAYAEESPTLKKIKAAKSITLGVRESSIPFSYLDDRQSYQGYSVDLCLKVVHAIEKKLGVQKLDVQMNPVTSATRIPLMENGTIDLECGSTTNNIERQKQVAFAVTTFVTGTRLLAKKTSNINTLADLKGKTLVATSGTTNLKVVTALNAEKNLGIKIVTGKDHAESFLMVETGRAAAFTTDDILLASLAANSKSPADYMITKDALEVEPYGIMLRREDPEFKKVVDGAIIDLFNSGEIKRIYAKWFQSPLPPKGINLNWPMSEQLSRAIVKPTDSGDPASYK